MENMDKDELIVFTCQVKKMSTRWGFNQKRNMMLTTKCLYNLEGHNFKRSIPLTKLAGLTKSN